MNENVSNYFWMVKSSWSGWINNSKIGSVWSSMRKQNKNNLFQKLEKMLLQKEISKMSFNQIILY